MENLLSAFQESLKKLGVSRKDRLLLAVSGGLDSTVLTALAAKLNLDFGIAHVNFQLRGAESQRDEEFVRQLAKTYQRPFFTKKMDTKGFASREKLSIQEAARVLRYDWFRELGLNGTFPYQYLLTAHHLDDQIETMLMHFFRGTGIGGLTGIPEKKDLLIRPLLHFSKERLKAFAVSEKLNWVEDASNASNAYTRNFFRNQLIPSVTTIFPDVLHNLENNLVRFGDAAILYRQAIDLHKKKLLQSNGSEILIPILLLKKSIPLRTIVFEIIKDYHFTAAQTDDIIQLMDSANGKYISSPTHRIIKNRRWLLVSRLEETSVSMMVIEADQASIVYPEGILSLKRMARSGADKDLQEPAAAFLSTDLLQFPLILRKWKAGDYFYPLGMTKKKKLARFFIDQKFSKTAKEKAWVLVSDKQIVWVVGYRIDNRFRVDNATRNVLFIRREPL